MYWRIRNFIGDNTGILSWDSNMSSCLVCCLHAHKNLFILCLKDDLLGFYKYKVVKFSILFQLYKNEISFLLMQLCFSQDSEKLSGVKPRPLLRKFFCKY